MSGNWTSWLIMLILVAYMIYSVFHTVQIYSKHRKALTEWKKANADAELFDDSKAWVISSGIMAVVGIVIALNIQSMNVNANSVGLYRVAYIMISIIFISMVFSSLANKRMWFVNDGFFFGDRFFKFKDIEKREPIGGIGSLTLHLVFKDKYAIQINKKMDDKITQKTKMWKANKKNRK